MSIKKDNVIATAVKYNNQDVNKVILDNECVWCKAFTYTQGTLPTGVASLTCTRSSTDEPTASAGTISNGGTIYYDDKLYWTATASTGYRITAVKGSNSPVTVTGAVTGTTASGLTSARISGTISQGTLPTGVASIKCYRKAYNGSSFSEYTGSTIYYGDQFYWTATATTGYNNPSLTYNSSSKTYTWNGSQGGTITSVGNSGLSAGSRKTFTITFGTTSGATLYGSWSKSSQTAEYGDKITVSGTTVTCYKWNATSTARWSVTATSSANTAQYTYSSPILLGSSITSVTAAATFTASNTRTLNSYTITWKYLSAYPDTWTTATEAYTYGATPSRTASNVTSGSARKVPTGWDSLATVTGNRTITATYKTQFNVTFSGTRCSAKIDNVAVSNGWYDSGKTVIWTANANCAFSSNGSTTTATDTISNQKTTYTATAGYINVTSVNGNNCTAYTDNTYATAFTTGWKSYGVSIYWKASAAYAFDTSNRDTTAGFASPGANTANANIVKRYTLTISATNSSYGTYSVSRTSSPYQGAATGALSSGATIYYGDVLTGTSSAKAIDYDSWSVTSVTAPTFTTTGAATSGNLTITNKSAYSATLYYNTSNAVGGTSAGTAATNVSKTVTGLDFNKQYYISARVSRTRTKHTYAIDGTQYSGTSSVTGNVTASFKFKVTNTTESGTIDSAVVAAKTAAQSTYTITWKYLKSYPDTWEQATQTYAYGATPSRTNPSTVTSGNERKVFVSWDNLTTVTGNRTITATYKTQFAPTITPSYCTSNRTSGSWYDSGTVITWTANDNYSFGGSAVKDTTTTTITAGNITYSKSPGYVKCTISGTRCTPSKTSGSILAVGTEITYTATSGYSYTEHATTASNPTKHTVALGTTSYSRSCDYKSITVSGTNCNANIATGYRKIGATITWTATSGTNYKYSFSNTTVDNSETATISTSTATYSKSASYLYYNVTISPATNCTANYSSGYLLNGTNVVFTAPAATTSKRYSFSTSSSTTTTCTKTVSAPNQAITNDTVYTYMNCTFSGNNCTKPTNGWYRVGTSQTFTASTGTNLKYSFTNTTANSPSTTASVTIADGTTAYTKNADYIFYNVTITKNTGTSSATYSSGYLLNGTTVTFTANAGTSTIKYSYSNTTSTTNTQSYTVSSAGQTISSGTVYTWCNITVNSTNCTASVASGWRLNGTTITWTPLPNYSFSEGTTQTNATATVSTSSFAYSAAPVYVKPASVSLMRCTCAVNTASKYYDSRQAYLVTANTNCAFNSTGTTTTKSLTLTAGAAVSYNANYVNVTKLTGTNCSTTATTGWKQFGTTIAWTANAAYAFDTSNKTSQNTAAGPGENTCTASYVKRYTLSITKNANVSSIKVWRESSPYQNAATSTQTSPLVNGTGTETVYYGDTIAGSATAATYYHFSGYADTQTSLSMAGTITDNYSWTPTVVGNGYAVTITAGKGIYSVYLSSSSTATSGSASGSNFPYGSTVYGFVALNRSLISSITVPSGWVAVGSGDSLTYRVGSGTVTASGYNFGTINATLAAYTVQVTAGTGVTKVYLSTNPNDYGSTTSTATAPFYAGTTVYAFAHINTAAGYTGNSNWTYIGSGNVFRVGSVYVTQAYNFGTINATPRQTYTVTISSSGVGLQRTWLSTSSSATSGTATVSVTSGTTVYGYAVLATDTYASKVSKWTLISGTACKQGAIYRVGSKTITAATTFDIDLYTSGNSECMILFTRSGEGVGTWTINDDTVQSMDSYGYFSKSGGNITFTGPDYNGNDWTITVATFTCPSGYTPTITMTDADGNSVAWNTDHYLNGPYTIEAETEESSSSQS